MKITLKPNIIHRSKTFRAKPSLLNNQNHQNQSKWIKVIRNADWDSFSDARQTFGSADFHNGFVIFDIGGNNFRILVKIEYQKHLIFIKHIFSHVEYDNHKNWRGCGKRGKSRQQVMAKTKTGNKIGNKTTGRFVDSTSRKSATSSFRNMDKQVISGKTVAKDIKTAGFRKKNITISNQSATERFDFGAYVQLLTETIPKVIDSQDEYDRLEAKFEDLLDKGEVRTLEEDSLFDLLANLLEDYEKRTLLPLEPTSPIATLKFLMEQNDLSQADMVECFGSQGNVSQVLAGKRAISKGAAQKLSKRFKLSTDTFLRNI